MIDKKQLTQKALRYIGIRPRSIEEVKSYLAKHKASESDSAQVLKYLIDHGLLNDTEFASWFASSRSSSKLKSKLEIQSELKRYAIHDQVFVDDDSTAEKLIQKKFFRFNQQINHETKRKIFAYMLKKGFKSSSIDQAIKKLYNQ